MNLNFEIADVTYTDILFDAEKLCFPKDFWSLDSIRNELLSERTTCIIALVDKKIIGYIFFSTVCDECELNRIAVFHEYRNLKIGKALIEKMKETLKNNAEIKKVYLEVRIGNVSAINLYLKTGFKKIGIRKKYYANPLEDALIMSLNLI